MKNLSLTTELSQTFEYRKMNFVNLKQALWATSQVLIDLTSNKSRTSFRVLVLVEIDIWAENLFGSLTFHVYETVIYQILWEITLYYYPHTGQDIDAAFINGIKTIFEYIWVTAGIAKLAKNWMKRIKMRSVFKMFFLLVCKALIFLKRI